jgi:phytoene dehydrogenase-like protein
MLSNMQYDVVVVGGGMAGLTAAAYLSRAGARVLLCEKEKQVGGLVNSFERGGFVFDGGIRAIENSGIVHPMLRQLGIDVEFLLPGPARRLPGSRGQDRAHRQHLDGILDPRARS